MNRNFSQFLQRLIEIFLSGFLITLFIPLKLRLFEPGIFLSGDFNPYTTSYLYVSDVFFLASLIFAVLQLLFFCDRETQLLDDKVEDWPFILFFSLVIIASLVSFFISSTSLESLFFSWRWVQMLILYFVISRKFLSLEKISHIFVWAMIVQTVFAGLQYLHGASLGLSFLGEPLLHVGEPGVATVSVFGRTVLRGYGTFLHPNIFAAYAIFGIFLSFLYRKTRPIFFSFAVFFLTIGVILSFSRVAFVALIILFLFSHSPVRFRLSAHKIGLFFLGISGVVAVGCLSGLFSVLVERFQFTDLASLQFRYANFVDGIKLFLHAPFGTGLGGSTAAMQSISPLKYAPWQYQPVHNLLLVVSNELGVFGLIVYVVGIVFLIHFLYLHRKAHPLHVAIVASFLCLSLSDHYFFTLYHGQILMTLFLSFLVPVAQESSPNSH